MNDCKHETTSPTDQKNLEIFKLVSFLNYETKLEEVNSILG